MTRDPAQRWSIADAQDYLQRGPSAAPVSTPVATPVAGTRSRTRTYDDDGTQVLPAGAPPAAPPRPPGPPLAPEPGRRRSDPRRGRWLVALLAALVLVAVTVVAFVVGLGGSDDDADPRPVRRRPRARPGRRRRPTPTSRPPPACRTSSGATSPPSVSDPAAAFDLLTPAFQEQSGGLDQYTDFWGPVESADVGEVVGDPETLQVRYSYTQEGGDGPARDDVTLQLTFADGTYLIDDEL